MNRFEQLVEKLKKQGSKELIILPGTTPRYLSRRGWEALEEEVLNPNQAQQICLSLLTPEEKENLDSKGMIRGSVFSKKGYSVSYDIQSTWSGYSAHFEVLKLSDAGIEGLQLPEVLRQSIERKGGIVLVTGPRRSGKTAVMSALLRHLNQAQPAVAMTFSEHPQFLRASETGTLIHHSLASISDTSSLLGRAHVADVIFIDSVRDRAMIEICFQFAEQGKLVIASHESLSLEMGLKRMVWSFPPDLRPMALEMLAKHLQVAVGLRLAPSQDEGQWSLASEILVNTPEVADRLLISDWEKLDELMKTRGEKTGMQTLNQSLLQLLLRRKIPLQVAYELSPNVEELHNMMEKVGV